MTVIRSQVNPHALRVIQNNSKDVARIHVEVRNTIKNSDGAIGTDADKVEFRYRDVREFLFEHRKM